MPDEPRAAEGALVGPIPRRVQVDGASFAVVDVPARSPDPLALPFVLLHGFTGHRDDFAGVLHELAAHRRVIVPDLRGHGGSQMDPGPSGWSLEQLVKDLAGLLDTLGIERCDLLGHSMGGMVALRFVLAHPERVRSLVLMSTAPEVPERLSRERFEKAAAIAEARGLGALQEITERIGRSEGRTGDETSERYWAHHRRRMTAMTPASYRGLGTALFEGGSVVDRLSEIRCPTTILVGSEDLDWLPGAARFAQHLPDAETIVIDGAGHHPHQERPEAWHRAIEAHLRRADRSRSQAGGGRMSLQAGHVGIETASGGTMGAYWARPEGKGPFPAVLVFMEIFGVNDHIRDVARRVAAEGYLALAPDFFHRTGPGLELGYDEAGMAEGMKHLGRLEAEQMIADARDAIAWLRRRDDVVGDRIGAMGFCIGGHMTYLTACETDIVAAAAYYGGGIAAPQGPGGGPSTLSRTPGIRGRIECYFGGRDAMIPIAQVDAIRSALAQAGVEHEVVVYDEADHGFHCDQRGTYHEASARDAWRRTLALFDATLRR